jgi:hypothetical protein
VKTEPPAPPPRDFDKEQGAINQILNALAPFPKEVQATLIKTVVVFKDIYIPRDI